MNESNMLVGFMMFTIQLFPSNLEYRQNAERKCNMLGCFSSSKVFKVSMLIIGGQTKAYHISVYFGSMRSLGTLYSFS